MQNDYERDEQFYLKWLACVCVRARAPVTSSLTPLANYSINLALPLSVRGLHARKLQDSFSATVSPSRGTNTTPHHTTGRTNNSLTFTQFSCARLLVVGLHTIGVYQQTNSRPVPTTASTMNRIQIGHVKNRSSKI